MQSVHGADALARDRNRSNPELVARERDLGNWSGEPAEHTEQGNGPSVELLSSSARGCPGRGMKAFFTKGKSNYL